MTEINAGSREGKRIAIFGFGDQETYADSFVDAIGQIYETIKNKGCETVEKIPTDGYEYDESMAEVNGQFIGLPLDEDNQSNLTERRIEKWVKQLKIKFK